VIQGRVVEDFNPAGFARPEKHVVPANKPTAVFGRGLIEVNAPPKHNNIAVVAPHLHGTLRCEDWPRARVLPRTLPEPDDRGWWGHTAPREPPAAAQGYGSARPRLDLGPCSAPVLV
jgi:hypothetical protein